MAEHQHEPDDAVQDSYYALRSAAIREVLIDKQLVSANAIRQEVERIESVTPALGARVVARAWVDAGFRERLLRSAREACEELGISVGTTLVAVENTDAVHNVVVCTLCSCYPTALLGQSPAWYKSLEYRSRTVSNPRNVLREFGLDLPSETEIRVYDSTADMRYIVLPQQPLRTEALTESQLAELVTRDSMIGVSRLRAI